MRKTLSPVVLAWWFSLAALSSCSGGTIGNPCTTDRDCEPGQSCFLNGFPGGYCSRGCTREGGVSIGECPGSSVCSGTSIAGSSTLFCADTCTDPSQCRESYNCRTLPGTDLKACAP